MNIYILQKSITDLKTPVIRKAYDTTASTVREFISEMVERDASKKTEPTDRIELSDALEKSGGDRFVYDRQKPPKFTVPEMQAFAVQAFEDKIYLIKNVTKNIMYERADEKTEFSENDEIALIKLKFIRGVL